MKKLHWLEIAAIMLALEDYRKELENGKFGGVLKKNAATDFINERINENEKYLKNKNKELDALNKKSNRK